MRKDEMYLRGSLNDYCILDCVRTILALIEL